MSDEREENVRAEGGDEDQTQAASIAQGIMDNVGRIRACMVLCQTDAGAQLVGAGDLTERLGLIEHARALVRAEAISRRRSADVQFLAFLEVFDAWCAADQQDTDAAAYDAMLRAREDLRAKGWG